MRTWLLVLAQISGVLSGPDPAQMEKAPDLGYKPIPHGLTLPAGMKMGAPSSAAFDAHGHLLVFTRGEYPLMEFDVRTGALVRTFGGGYVRAHGMRVDPEGHIWTTDVNGHTVTKMSPAGEVLLTLGTKGQPGAWDEAKGTRLLYEPNDVAFAPNGDLFIVQGHGRGEPRVLRFDRRGTFITSWGGTGTGPGQFNLSHSVIVDAQSRVYVADRENRRVQIFDVNGRFLKEWRFAGLPCGLYMGKDQQIYLASGFAGQILKLDANGNAIGMMGQPGKGLGEFGEAHFLTLGPNGDIYVADTVKPDLHRFAAR
ncbi:MAG: peptidyl-alpha-hydroxyglycine alpha-amidating lyase family protein [Vicinamibacterales bacterium]